MNFNNKVVWITGASSGIGEHLAYAFAAEGAKLVISSRNKKELERVKQNCNAETDVMILPMDVADFDAIPGKAQTILDPGDRVTPLPSTRYTVISMHFAPNWKQPACQ